MTQDFGFYFIYEANGIFSLMNAHLLSLYVSQFAYKMNEGENW